jgi:hypothetical protein
MKFLVTLLFLFSMRSEANVCAQDAKKFCSGTEPGKGQLAKCLTDYESQLSSACSKELKTFKSNTGKKNPCFEDLAEYCTDIPTDNRKLQYCLLKNENRLGSKCSADFKQKKPNIIVKDVCAQDIVNICYSTISESESATTRCLIKNKVKLSNFCQRAVDKRVAEMKKVNPCFDDAEKHCPTQTQFADIHSCMSKKLKVLGPECKKMVQHEINLEKANPCYMDMRKHCKKGLSASEQHRCLTVNEDHISNSCKQFRVNEADKLKKMVDLCEADRLKLCPKAPFQNGMILKCLKENVAKVTPGCKAML